MAFNSREFENFLNNLKNVQKGLNSFLTDFLMKNAMESLAKTKKRTPVDTGELRRNWYITDVSRKSNSELIVYLYNTKDYANFVEYGHTTRNREGWVQGYFMATVSIEELERKIPARFEREFMKYVNSLGI